MSRLVNHGLPHVLVNSFRGVFHDSVNVQMNSFAGGFQGVLITDCHVQVNCVVGVYHDVLITHCLR